MGQQPFGDTTLTKVFVGGLAWETQKDTLRDHFAHFGDILEAVIIFDKASGRSKGYGFVTFKDAEAAKKACEDPTPVINGRRANCNLASRGARRPRASPPATPPLPVRTPPPGGRAAVAVAAAGQWYYATGTPAPVGGPYHQHQQFHGGVVPYYPASAAAYGYAPSYVMNHGFNQKINHGGGSYVYPNQQTGRCIFPSSAMLPVYPVYHFQHHQPHTMGLPAHVLSPTTPAIISKPPPLPPTTTVEPVKGCS